MTEANMPTSWPEFLVAVERMRESQKEYNRTKTPASFHAMKKCESVVDGTIKQQREKWARKAQPELPQGGTI